MMPSDQKPSSGWTTLVGINSLNAAGQNSWQSAVTVSEAALGARDKWVKFTGIASNNGGGRTRAVVWISTRGASGSGTPVIRCISTIWLSRMLPMRKRHRMPLTRRRVP